MPTLPTTGLTGHFDASDADKLFTTYQSSGVHTGTPSNGSNVQVWDDEGDGISNVAFIFTDTGSEPNWHNVNTTLGRPALNFIREPFNALGSYTQTADFPKDASDFVTASDFAVFMAFSTAIVLADDANVWNNECLLADLNAYFGLLLRDNAGTPTLQGYSWDGNADVVEKVFTLDKRHVARLRHNGGNLYLSLDGGSESSTAAGDTSSLTAQLRLGHRGGAAFEGWMGEVAIYNSGATGSVLTQATEYFLSKWMGSSSQVGQKRRVYQHLLAH